VKFENVTTRRIIAWEITVWTAILLLALLINGCKGVQGGVIGGATGALTGTPQGIGVGAAAGFVVGLWNDITTAVAGWWSNLWGTGQVPPPSNSGRIWSWLLLLVLFGFLVKLCYHFVWDAEFRNHLWQFIRTSIHPRPKGKRISHADPAS
jgi:hypothetical protein